MSGIGKGITSSSLALLLRAACENVTMAKVDPYLNEDAGTMSPYEHGECFVLDDGMEADLDLGNYERFLERPLTKASAITSGQIYRAVFDKERRGDYLGKTVQMLPHVTDEICRRIKALTDADDTLAVVELGGTVGDIESDVFYAALRKLHHSEGRDAFCHVHVSVLMETAGGELKTKPTQHSVEELNKRGIMPDMLCLRLPKGINDISDGLKDKIAEACGYPTIFVSPTCSSVYAVPGIFDSQNVLDKILYPGVHEDMQRVTLGNPAPQILAPFSRIATGVRSNKMKITIVGKYLHRNAAGEAYDGSDAYLSLRHALDHAAISIDHYSLPTLEWVDAEDVMGTTDYWLTRETSNDKPKAIILTGGFGPRGYDGFVQTALYALDAKVPILGICLGFQMMTLALAHMSGIKDADTSERNGDTPAPVIHIHHDSKEDDTKGGTLRRGSHLVTSTNPLMGKTIPTMNERFRHRYHLNPEFVSCFDPSVQWDGEVEDLPGVPTRLMVQGHPFFWATQAHCELTSRPSHPSPYFVNLIKAMG